jgi:hypothetical protein
MSRLRSRLIVAIAFIGAADAAAQVSIVSSTVQEREAALGETYTGRIIIANTSKTPQAVRLYQTDYHFSADGTNSFADPGTTPRSNASWVSPGADRVTVPASSEVTVIYSVKTPEADSLAGTFWSAIMVEGPLTRTAVQVATHVAKTGVGEIRFENPQPVKSGTGAAGLDIDVINTGTRGVTPTMSVELYDAQGVITGKSKALRGLLYPGTSLRQHFEFGTLPPGTYKAIVFADARGEKVFTAQLTITY